MAMTLQHPGHVHTLTRMQLSGHSRPFCGICTGQVHGTAYSCEGHGCNLFLHEPCALVEFPLQITKHPIHPKHPLVFERPFYRCNLCNISVVPSVVVAILPPLEADEDVIHHHVAHDHPLTAFHVKVPNWISCGGCQERIPGPAYGCYRCCFFLHDSCARLPREMPQHPFHPECRHPLALGFKGEETFTCKACRTAGQHQLAYSCRECTFELDVTCAALPLSLQDQEKDDRVAIHHFSHQHQLLPGCVGGNEHPKLCCAVCELQISGEVYHCPGCIFFLHKLCADELLKDMMHYLHPEHPLVLLQKPLYSTGVFSCDCCRIGYSGMVFHCASCSFDLDPKCALQTSSAFRDGAAAKIEHFSHEEHPLVLRYFKGPQTSSSCKACLEATIGLAYSCDNCPYVLHKSCAELPLQLEHPLHSLHPLTLIPRKPETYFNCSNCSILLLGFSFRCIECEFYLCKPCATERPTLKHQLHEHTLSYFERSFSSRNKSLRCNSCAEASLTDLYSCTPCNFHLHRGCLPLPPTIKHEWHPYHPLVLFDRFVDGLPEYQYCDYCEEIRNPDHGVYRCEECWLTVHIGCVLPQVTRYKNTHDKQLRKEIASLEKDIKIMEKDLKASKQKLKLLKGEDRHELSKA